MKIAHSHDWLNGMRGGEKCLEAIAELYPGSPIYTLFHENGKISATLEKHPIQVSWIQKLPDVYKRYRHYLPLFPRAIESFCLKDAEVVISTSHCVAKGIRKSKGAVHICYCFTPMRYAWDLFDEYFGAQNFFLRKGIAAFMPSLRKWDYESSRGVDHFIAISEHVKKRIQRFYKRSAEVIYPPVDTDFFTSTRTARENFYLIVSALVPYKRIDVAIQAFNCSGKRLVVIGEGPERKKLEALAKKNVEFLGWQPDELIRQYYRRARALIFPGEEDFGIVPVEMQACGGFVLALAKGGALETVRDGKTGLFFPDPDERSIVKTVERFEGMHWIPEDSRQNAAGFSRERFKKEMRDAVARLVLEHQGKDL